MATIEFEKQGHAAWITLNRPEAKNLMNAERKIRSNLKPVDILSRYPQLARCFDITKANAG